ncbi:hypothetical protein RFI_31795 [Reticulomyxa filosa]|uniref:Uncharacterized protein n=1 Tax=Reticulomyxa filosa TaxID=46433 RepID=X6LUJ2_RETFI|nr:hypothetical protein RFI_31795 [Reticulomyxa filosa]|eukprot:ETO05603.1 hypothetical protein RFI_31795 [Reticulomyxa filosa]
MTKSEFGTMEELIAIRKKINIILKTSFKQANLNNSNDLTLKKILDRNNKHILVFMSSNKLPMSMLRLFYESMSKNAKKIISFDLKRKILESSKKSSSQTEQNSGKSM